MTTEKLAYSIAGAVEASGLSRAYIYEHIKGGRLKTIKAGRRTLVLAEDLRAWLSGFRSEAA